jgi:Tfp pilus assembly protein PilF
MNRFGILLLALLALLTSACHTVQKSDPSGEAQQRWNGVRGRVKEQLAAQQYDSGLFEEAVRTLTEVIGLDPGRADAYALLAQANLELGKPGSARQALDAARRVGVQSPDLTYLEGVLLELQNRHADALAKYTEARRAVPTNTDYLVAQTECLVELGRADEAMVLLNEAAGQLNDDATVPVLTAQVASLLGDTAEASRRYRQALVEGSDSPLVAQELGLLLVRAGRYNEAVVVLSPLLAASCADPASQGAVRRALAVCYLAMGDPKSAKGALRDYARRHTDDTRAQLLLAKAALANGDTLTALRAVDLVERREPDRPELWLVRATLRFTRGDLAGAAADLYDVLADNPDDVDAHCLLAEVLRARGQLDAARVQFERALEIDPQCAWASAGLEALADAEPPDPGGPSIRLTSSVEPPTVVMRRSADGNGRPIANRPVFAEPYEDLQTATAEDVP